MATTKRTDKTTDKAQSKTSIPLAVRDSGTKPSANDMLASLSKKATAAPKKAASGKDRPVLELASEACRMFAEYAPIKVLSDLVVSRAEALKADINEYALKAWIAWAWKNKNRPTNPVLRVEKDGKPDCEAMFVVQERFKIQIPDESDPVNSVIKLLDKSGLDESQATKLVEEEIDFQPQIGLRPFTELVNGHYVEREFFDSTPDEKAVGQKLLEFVMTQLTDEEKALVLVNTPKTTVKKGFLERVTKYCTSQDELESVFKVLVPVVQNKSAKFGINDTPVDKTARLIEAAKDILGDSNLSDDDDE